MSEDRITSKPAIVSDMCEYTGLHFMASNRFSSLDVFK